MIVRLIILANLFCASAFAQLKRDSILLHERAMDRPITVHRGQLRMTGGYDFYNFRRHFTSASQVNKLSDEGRTKVRSEFLLYLEYGITDYIEVAAAVASKTELRRGEYYSIFDNAGAIEIQNESETRGLDDLLFSTSLRVPLKTKKVDLSATIGATIPTSKYSADIPDHSVRQMQDGDYYFTQITYVDRQRWGKGVPVGIVGFQGKYRFTRMAINCDIEYRHAFSESKSNTWKYRLLDSAFAYEAIDYTHQVPDVIMISAGGEYQLFPWIDVIVGLNATQSSGGWSSISGHKVAYGKTFLVELRAALEILITHRMWMKESVSYSLTGKNMDAPFCLSVGVTYSLFP